MGYPGESFQSNALNTAGTLQIKTTVTDSRGRTGELAKSITVVDYFPPTITGMTYIPCNSDGSENPNGEYIKVSISGKVAAVSNQNTRSLVLKYKKSSAAAYTTKTITLSSYVFDTSTILSNIDPTSTYELACELTDKKSVLPHTAQAPVYLYSLFLQAAEEHDSSEKQVTRGFG